MKQEFQKSNHSDGRDSLDGNYPSLRVFIQYLFPSVVLPCCLLGACMYVCMLIYIYVDMHNAICVSLEKLPQLPAIQALLSVALTDLLSAWFTIILRLVFSGFILTWVSLSSLSVCLSQAGFGILFSAWFRSVFEHHLCFVFPFCHAEFALTDTNCLGLGPWSPKHQKARSPLRPTAGPAGFELRPAAEEQRRSERAATSPFSLLRDSGLLDAF